MQCLILHFYPEKLLIRVSEIHYAHSRVLDIDMQYQLHD